MKRLLTLLAIMVAAAMTLTAKALPPEIDSLVKVARLAHDSIRPRLYNDIAWKLRYADPKLAIKYAKTALETTKEPTIHNLSEEARANTIIGICYKNLGE